MPKAHRAHLEWSPTRLIGWGATIGRHTEALVQALLESRPHPEQGYRSCLGILRLAKQHGPERLDAACGRAVAAGARSGSRPSANAAHFKRWADKEGKMTKLRSQSRTALATGAP
jgi:transposase